MCSCSRLIWIRIAGIFDQYGVPQAKAVSALVNRNFWPTKDPFIWRTVIYLPLAPDFSVVVVDDVVMGIPFFRSSQNTAFSSLPSTQSTFPSQINLKSVWIVNYDMFNKLCWLNCDHSLTPWFSNFDPFPRNTFDKIPARLPAFLALSGKNSRFSPAFWPKLPHSSRSILPGFPPFVHFYIKQTFRARDGQFGIEMDKRVPLFCHLQSCTLLALFELCLSLFHSREWKSERVEEWSLFHSLV